MGADEAGTARALRKHRAAIDPIAASHGGRIVKTTGDVVLLEFPSIVAAVECAVGVQKLMGCGLPVATGAGSNVPPSARSGVSVATTSLLPMNGLAEMDAAQAPTASVRFTRPLSWGSTFVSSRSHRLIPHTYGRMNFPDCNHGFLRCINLLRELQNLFLNRYGAFYVCLHGIDQGLQYFRATNHVGQIHVSERLLKFAGAVGAKGIFIF
jgi:hypothetical protein